MATKFPFLCLALSAFVGASAGCRYLAETTPPPAKSNMVFTRDLYKGKACLEYSWVSEGKRRVIQLNPNVKEGEGEGPTAKKVSHVQVYALSNGLYGLKDWQFPSGPPHPSPVVRASVEVKETEAVGTVVYQDQSTATDTKALVPMPVACPTKVEDAAIVDPAITDLDPRTVARNRAVTITLIGSNFTKDSVVLIDGANPTTRFVSPSVLEAGLEAEDTATAGKRGVKVHDAKHGRTSNEVMLSVE
ncbi:MAG TPA: IPT/TIG domain-containing protein [Nitrospira sp.]|nr:IPT/TIG domain-containing protein [Nitrospira sp.]